MVTQTKAVGVLFAFATVAAASGWPATALGKQPSTVSVVVSLRGQSDVKRSLGRRVRRTLADDIGPLKSSRKWQRSLAKLGLSGSAKNRAVNIARAARMVRADYVLDLKMMRQDERQGVKVRVIRAQDGLILVRRRLALGEGANAVNVLADRVVRLALFIVRPPSREAPAPMASSTTGTSSTMAESASKANGTAQPGWGEAGNPAGSTRDVRAKHANGAQAKDADRAQAKDSRPLLLGQTASGQTEPKAAAIVTVDANTPPAEPHSPGTPHAEDDLETEGTSEPSASVDDL